MPPFLFSTAMEYLSRCLNSLKNEEFGFHPKCKRNQIIPLLVVDNLLIFYKGDTNFMSIVKAQLDKFSLASSLRANVVKSVVYVTGVSEEVVGQTRRVWACHCVPLYHKKLTISQ